MTTTEHPDTTVIRLSGAEGVVIAAAHLLGFQPAESLVLACMTRARGRVGPVIRVDLGALAQPDALRGLAETAAQYAEHIAVLVYHADPLLPPLAAMRRALGQFRIPISYQLSVRGGMIRDARSAAAYGRDRGIPVPTIGDRQFDRLAAASALVGKRVLPDRAALALSITPDPADDAPLIARIRRARRALPFRNLPPGAELSAERSALVDEIWARAAAEYREQGAVAPDAAAQVIALMQAVPCRDQILARSVRDGASDRVAVLVSIAAQCPDRYAPELCSVLAAAAYRFGDGALANCALDRALATRPDHRLSSLLRATIESHLHPSALASLGDRRIPADSVTPAGPAPPPPADPPPS